MRSRKPIVFACLALMLIGLVLDVLTPQQFIAAIVWTVPIALSGLAFSRGFTFSLVVSAILLSVVVSWLNAGAQGNLDTVAVLNRVLLAGSAVMVGVMTVNLSAFAQRLGQFQEREAKIRQERDAERIALTVGGAQRLQAAFEAAAPVVQQLANAQGVLMVAVQDNTLVAPRVFSNPVVLGGIPFLELGSFLPEDLRHTPEDTHNTIVQTQDQHLAHLGASSVLVVVFGPEHQTVLRQLWPVLSQALERVVLLEGLSLQQGLLQRRNTLIRDLVYAFSHDLRTPLMANAMNMKLALDGAFGALPDDYLRSLRNGLATNEDLLKLADALLLVARFESGDSNPQTEQVDLQKNLHDMLDRLTPVASARGVQLEARLEAVNVRGNSLDLRRVMQNLLDNAIKFSPKGSVVRVVLRCKTDNGLPKAHLEVHDAGPGVSPELEARLFTRFSSSRAGGGSGLGLYLAKCIVEAHQGRIGHRRNPHTVFWVELPVQKELPRSERNTP